MLETLRAWLNGSKEYFSGVVLYQSIAGNTALYNLFVKAKTDYTAKRLEKELFRLLEVLKKQNDGQESSTIGNGNGETPAAPSAGATGNSKEINKAINEEGKNHDDRLYQSCKNAADKAYKQVMNLRAQLFAQAAADDFSDPNMPDKIAARTKSAIEVVSGFNHVSQLYEKADYVLRTGKLPADGQAAETPDFANIPVELVKQTLDNKRKALSKLKAKDPTPERIARIQQHQSDITILENRWRSLQPQP